MLAQCRGIMQCLQRFYYAVFFLCDVLDEILIESVSKGFSTYSFYEILEYHAVDIEK